MAAIWQLYPYFGCSRWLFPVLQPIPSSGSFLASNLPCLVPGAVEINFVQPKSPLSL